MSEAQTHSFSDAFEIIFVETSVLMDSDDILSHQERKRNKRIASMKKYTAKRRKCYHDSLNLSKKRHLIDLSTSSQSESCTTSDINPSSSDSESINQSSPTVDVALTSPEAEDPREDANSCSYQDLGNAASLVYESDADSCTSDGETMYGDASLWEDIRRDVLQTNMTETQVNCLLRTLRKHNIGPLPLDRRTLVKTSTKFVDDIKEVAGMEYYFFGFEKEIVDALHRFPATTLEDIDTLIIKDNVDGLPMYKSSSKCFWPLLAKIDNIQPSVVFPVLLSSGTSKPDNLSFLKEAVTEMNSLEESGLSFKGKHFNVKFAAHICDTPARNMVKACVNFNAYHGCDYCTERGFYDGKRMTWPVIRNLRLRTDQSFRHREQAEHHKNHVSPYEETSADMILSFPIDFMHLGGGVMRKVMKWTLLPGSSDKRRRCRMSSSNIRILNSRLLSLRSCIPNCFVRKPRSTKELPKFKATELRQLLLYTSILVFKGLMPSDAQYINLCCLYVGCRLLTDQRTVSAKNDLAHSMLEQFCASAKAIYGLAFMVYNVHGLLHLPQIGLQHGSLDTVSSYPFESYLGELKRSVRSARHPIVSAVKAVVEKKNAAKSTQLSKAEPKIYTKYPNNIYIDIDRHMCYCATKVVGGNVKVKEYKTRPYFRRPVSSDVVGCYKIKGSKFLYRNRSIEEVLALRRGMMIDLNTLYGLDSNESVCIAMLHDECDRHQ